MRLTGHFVTKKEARRRKDFTVLEVFKMKKIVSLLLSLALVFVLTACSIEESAASDPLSGAPAAQTSQIVNSDDAGAQSQPEISESSRFENTIASSSPFVSSATAVRSQPSSAPSKDPVPTSSGAPSVSPPVSVANPEENRPDSVASVQQTPPSVETPPNTATEIVYITQTGKKYHATKSCTGLNNAKAIYETTLSNAQSQGLGPCARCH